MCKKGLFAVNGVYAAGRSFYANRFTKRPPHKFEGAQYSGECGASAAEAATAVVFSYDNHLSQYYIYEHHKL